MQRRLTSTIDTKTTNGNCIVYRRSHHAYEPTKFILPSPGAQPPPSGSHDETATRPSPGPGRHRDSAPHRTPRRHHATDAPVSTFHRFGVPSFHLTIAFVPFRVAAHRTITHDEPPNTTHPGISIVSLTRSLCFKTPECTALHCHMKLTTTYVTLLVISSFSATLL